MGDLTLALTLPAFLMAIPVALWMEAGLSSHTLDFNLYAFDASLGFHPSFWMGRIVSGTPWLHGLCASAYYGLAIIFVILATGAEVSFMRPNLIKAMLAAAVVGSILYFVVPAPGPVFVLPNRFPFSPPTVSRFRRTALLDPPRTDPRNCMPSLHLSWALLIYLNVRWSRWRRICAGLLVVLTVMATMGFGQHYLIDLIVAVPFTLAVQEVSERQWFPAIINGALTIAWLLALRFDAALLHEPAFLAWALVVGTLAGAITIHNLKIGGGASLRGNSAEEESLALQIPVASL